MMAAGTGATTVDLGDRWAPEIFAETSDRPQSYRRTFVALANEEVGQGREWDVARRDRHFELYGIFPSFSVIRARLLDEARHVCHASIDDGALSAATKTLAPWSVSSKPSTALAVVQRHLRCEALLDGKAGEGMFDSATQEALRVYQRRHMLPSAGVIDAETREALLTDSRELDFRTLLRALRERVVAATGLIEDGSALNAWQPIFGRFIESAEYRRVLRPEPLVRGAADLVAAATQAAAIALGWTSPEAAARALASGVPARVVTSLPAPPAYHGPHMRFRAEIDRGDVWVSYPLDAEGQRRRSPVKNRPTFTLYAVTENGDIPLVRWPTTIGAWKQEKLADETMALRYKGSPVGRRYWRDLIAAPAWFPPPTTPDSELVRRRADGGWAADEEAVGPGYRSAYGLVALFHHREITVSGGGTEYADVAIRTHGSGNYRSILRGSSHGCHRLFNHLAIRLGSFVLAHGEHTRHGLTDERYGRVVNWQGRVLRLRAESRGYRYELLPPIPVDVLPGRTVRSKSAPARPDGAVPPAPGAQPSAPTTPQT